MLHEMWNAPPGFRPSKSAPCSPAKPTGILRTRSESFNVTHKVPVGDTPYVRAKNVQLVEKDPEKSIPLFWAAINAGDRVDSALKDLAIVMKQQNRAEEAIEAIKSLRNRCSDQAQESLDNILLDLYKRCGRLEDQIGLLRHKLYLIQQGMAFNGKRTKTARSQGKKFQVSVEQEATRLLVSKSGEMSPCLETVTHVPPLQGNLGWALMQQNNYVEAEDAYRRALAMAPDNNKMCNLGICLMKQGRMSEAKEALRRVKSAVAGGPRGGDSHLKAYERAQQMLHDLESTTMSLGSGDPVQQRQLFDAFLGSSSIWQPQPCRELNFRQPRSPDEFPDENLGSSAATKMGIWQGNSNSLNIDARPFVSWKFGREQATGDGMLMLKRTRSENAAAAAVQGGGFVTQQPFTEAGNKARRRSLSPEEEWAAVLPDTKDFEEAIIAAVLDPEVERGKTAESGGGAMNVQRKADKRLKVFEDITLSLSPRV